MASQPAWLKQSRDSWENRGQTRPAFAIEPAEGQESVWDYPRPPIVVQDHRRVVVAADSTVVADTTDAIRVLETAGPPTFYVPPTSVNVSALELASGSSHCEWKGYAQYWRLAADTGGQAVGWSYPKPYDEYAELAGWFSFYPARITCTVDDEIVRPQPGGFYGGWVTDEIVGPVKGEPGTQSW